MGDIVGGILGTRREEAAPVEQEPDWEGMWSNYSRWVGEAGERYESDLRSIQRMPGLGTAGRAQAGAEREAEYNKELSDIRGGATARQLEQRFRDTGSGATMEDYFTSQFGGYKSEADVASAGEAARRGPAPGSQPGTEADIASLGETRPWWAG